MAQSRPFHSLLICAAACKDEANWFFTPTVECSKPEIVIKNKIKAALITFRTSLAALSGPAPSQHLNPEH